MSQGNAHLSAPAVETVKITENRWQTLSHTRTHAHKLNVFRKLLKGPHPPNCHQRTSGDKGCLMYLWCGRKVVLQHTEKMSSPTRSYSAVHVYAKWEYKIIYIHIYSFDTTVTYFPPQRGQMAVWCVYYYEHWCHQSEIKNKSCL